MDAVKSAFFEVLDFLAGLGRLILKKIYDTFVIAATSGAVFAALFWLLNFIFGKYHMPLSDVLMAWLVVFVLVFFLFLIFAHDDKADEQEDKGAASASFEQVEAAGMVNNEGIPLGYILQETQKKEVWRRLRYAGENHLFTLGKPGTGKGSTVIIPALLQYPGSCIVIDPKGQNAAVTARARGLLGHKVYILNPFNVLPDHLNKKGAHVKNLAGFNPLDRISQKSNRFVSDVGSLAQALIIQQGGESHWPDSARGLVACLIMHVCLTAPHGKRNLGEVRALLGRPIEPPDKKGNPQGFLAVVDSMCKSSFSPLAIKAGQFKATTDEMGSVISTARTQLAFLDDPAICKALESSDFSFSFLKRQKVTVYLVLPFNQIEAQARWLRLLITSALEELTEEPRKGDGRVLFMLDEFAQLGRLPAIERALALVRGYGVQLWPFVQDLPQLKSIYNDRWESFLASAGVAQFFTPNDKMTAEYISKRCGQTLKRRSSVSSSETENSREKSKTAGESHSEHWEQLFTEWDLYGEKLDNKHQLIFLEGLSPVIYAARNDYFRFAELRALADPDPFHL